jgi:dipeptidyl aminopeptidase/acylaminoacyl peptidase
MKRWKTMFVAALAAAPMGYGQNAAAGGRREAPGLIPRDVLFGNPDKAQARLSPDGKRIAYLAPVEGVLNVFVGAPEDVQAARPVTHDAKRGIRQYFWAYTSRHILYLQDEGGNENWRIYSVDLESGKTADLTPLEGVQARVEQVSKKHPDQIVVGLNDREPHQFHDLYRVDLGSGERTLLYRNDRFVGFDLDDDFDIRVAAAFNPDGGITIFKAEGGPGAEPAFAEWMSVPQEDTLTTSILGFDDAGETLYYMDSRGRNTGALFALDWDSGKTRLLAENPRADISGTLVDPQTGKVQAASANYDRVRWTILDPAIRGDFEYLRTVAEGDFTVTSRTLDDSRWTVAYLQDNGPARTYLYERGGGTRSTRFLFTNKKALEGLTLAKMHPVVIKSRDGMDLVSYLSLPPESDPDGDGRPSRPLPMVMDVHGGPWARDSWGLNPEHQWLANRGYAVLSVNYRGSTGFGKEFVNAGNLQWAAKMHDDLIDAVDWAVAQGIAQEDRVAIMGGSYGGYATLVGLTFTPEKFAAGIDIVGPSNLNTLLKSIPPYWKPIMTQFTTRVGDPSTPEGARLLEERSPLTRVHAIKRPLLIGQGANDPRVKQAEADQIVSAMQAKGIPVTYVLYPDEGHGFARPPNRMSFYAVSESFLKKHLGGRAEAIGKDFEGSTIQVKAGADQVPGLAEALGSK